MDETSGSLIYGLELQSRTMTAQLAEGNEIRYFIGTNSLKPENNQIHLIEVNEETPSIKAKIFAHPFGEIWKINSSPHNSRTLLSCYKFQKGIENINQAAILNMPDDLESRNGNEEFIAFENIEILPTEKYGQDILTTEFHPNDEKTLATVIDGKIILYNRSEAKTQELAEISSKNFPKFTTGKWSQHHQGNQFIVLHDCAVKSYDIRDTNNCAWNIEEAHGQLIRDLDCNPNKTCHIATAGDDGYLKIWDTRLTKEPIFSRADHHHWIWCVRFNTFHDQLLLTSSSDGKVLLTSAGTVSSEILDEFGNNENNGNRKPIQDGLLQTFDQHEDSVYCVEWSNVDPWIFASLSYDGRVIISKISKQFKYQILF